MNALRFDGRVAVVTGAGRGIGRAYAHLLAARGASVVVNDLGGSREGDGIDAAPAQSVVEEIVAAGGQAVADTNDVSTLDGGSAIIDSAIRHFGRIDAVVNNAGIVKYGGLPNVELSNVERNLDVHLIGSFTTTRAAWPYFVEQGYGRVVLTTSSGVFGLDNNLPYASAKAGVIGLARSAKLAGEPHGIRVNVIAPAAVTRMAVDIPLDGQTQEVPDFMSPEAVAPMVAVLAHESCPANGEIYTAGGGRFARLFIASTEGYLHRGSDFAAPEEVVANWQEINDEEGYYVPEDLPSWSNSFLRHQFAPQTRSGAQ
ncbi:SDR family NAD(P)-dependent oxidoreductase [Gordonia sp. DT218]|uniref:SDR family NAD(P)-dependent oxidoreductase n=1 Tax=Gordonia sp. DT218 TaxID=3416659 RepID=UPI003CE870A5